MGDAGKGKGRGGFESDTAVVVSPFMIFIMSISRSVRCVY